MAGTFPLKRRIVIILLFFIFLPFYCIAEQPWVFSKIKSGNCNYKCGKITYPVENPQTGLELNFIRSACGLRGTVSVRCRTIPPYEGDERVSIATLYINQQAVHFLADRMAGGQELLLPLKITQMMIDALAEEATLTLFLNGYEAQISPCNFCKSFHKLERLRICEQQN